MASPAFIIGATLLAGNHVPIVGYFAFIVIGLAGLGIFCRRYNLLHPPVSARLAIGAYFAVSLFNMATGITRHSLEQIVTGGFLATVFFLLAFAAPRERNLVPGPALSPAENQK